MKCADRFAALGAAGLLTVHAVLALWACAGKGTTGDELLHLTAGYSFWDLHDYRLHPENGNLPQRWAAVPALFMRPPFPKLEGNSYWRTSEVQIIGHQFLYETGYDHFPMLMAGRAMIVAFSVATGALVFLWSRKLFGNAGGLLSVALYAFSPHFLAHGALVTSDMCMTFFFLATCGAWWRHLHRPGLAPWLLSAVVFGLACVAKHSAVLLLPMMMVMAGVRAWATEPLHFLGRTCSTRAHKFGVVALSALGHFAIAALVIWAFYGFRYTAFNPRLPPAVDFIRPWEMLDLNIGVIGKVIRLLSMTHVLPEAFLYGTAYVVETAQVRAAFLNGEYSTTGWLSFFPWAFVLKSTLATLAVTGFVSVLAGLRWSRTPAIIRRDFYAVLPLVALFVIYWIFSLASHLNIGHRHILPTYPVIFIAAGVLTRWISNRRAAIIFAGVLGAAQVIEAVRIAPDFLTYFNAIGGGPENGHRHLVDSSLDWGQDLPGLAKWLDTHARSEPVFLSYFGTDEPDYHRIRARRLPFINGFKLLQPYVVLEPGIYCISATMLQHVYSSIRGPWTLELEREFQVARGLEATLIDFQTNPEKRTALLRVAPLQNWNIARMRLEQLQFARLCYYLRVRDANASIGHSIFIYHLNAHEIDGAVRGSLTQWRQLIEDAVAQRLTTLRVRFDAK